MQKDDVKKIIDIKSLLDDAPTFQCNLPSNGKVVEIQPLTTGQMKKLLSYNMESDQYVIEDVMDSLIMSCVVSDDFNIDDLYLQDRFFLFLEIRKVTKGSDYNFSFRCRHCENENITSFDINDLEVTDRACENGTINISKKLSFEIDFPKRSDQKNAITRARRKKYKNDTEKSGDIGIFTYANSVRSATTPDGSFLPPFEDRVYTIETVNRKVFDEFKQWFIDNDFGVKFEREVECRFCNKVETLNIPLTDFFN